MILESANKLECERNFFSMKKITDLLGYVEMNDPGQQTKFLLEQFCVIGKHQKEPMRRSPRK